MSTRRTGEGRYTPARRSRRNSRNMRSTPNSSTAAKVIRSTPAAPLFAFTRSHASHRTSPCGHGQTERGNADPQTAWPQPIADVAVFALSPEKPSMVPRLRQAEACRGDWTGQTQPCPHAYPLHQHDQSRSPSLPARSVAHRSAVSGRGRLQTFVRYLRPPCRTARAVFPQAALNGCSPSGGSSHAYRESVAGG